MGLTFAPSRVERQESAQAGLCAQANLAVKGTPRKKFGVQKGVQLSTLVFGLLYAVKPAICKGNVRCVQFGQHHPRTIYRKRVFCA